jgi:hypothetical protein
MESAKPYLERVIPLEAKQKLSEWLLQLKYLFVSHPRETGETYMEHLAFTVKMGVRIVTCGVLLLIHGLFPFTFRRTVSMQIEKIYAILKGRIPKNRLQEIDENWQI